MVGATFLSCSVPNTVAITFDDGPCAYTGAILDVLAAHNASATFILNGNNWGCIYDANKAALVQRMVAEGHQVAHHSWSHPLLTNISLADVAGQITLLDDALLRIVGLVPAFMRPPYGATNANVTQVMAAANKTIALWDLDSHDWQWTGLSTFLASVQSVYNASVRAAAGGGGGGRVPLSRHTPPLASPLARRTSPSTTTPSWTRPRSRWSGSSARGSPRAACAPSPWARAWGSTTPQRGTARPLRRRRATPRRGRAPGSRCLLEQGCSSRRGAQ